MQKFGVLTALVIMLLSRGALAGPHGISDDECQKIASYSRKFMEMRDNGTSEEMVHALTTLGAAKATPPAPDAEVEFIHIIIHSIFTNSYAQTVSPQLYQLLTYDSCTQY